MFSNARRDFLRRVLWADAISCLACGLLQVGFTKPLAQILGLPITLLADTGWFLLAYGAAVAFFAARMRRANALIWLLIVGNIGWGIAAVSILLNPGLPTTLLGKGYIIVQALTVLILAQLQYRCVRPERARGVGETAIERAGEEK